jgi:hypothetical protein
MSTETEKWEVALSMDVEKRRRMWWIDNQNNPMICQFLENVIRILTRTVITENDCWPSLASWELSIAFK